MSAYIVEKITIDAIVHFFSRTQYNLYVGNTLRFDPNKFNDLQRIGQILTDENYRSVNYRYDTETLAPIYLYHRTQAFAPVVILKLLACYDYQACETPDYERSIACKIANEIRKNAVTFLPGYEDAPWGLDESCRYSLFDNLAVYPMDTVI